MKPIYFLVKGQSEYHEAEAIVWISTSIELDFACCWGTTYEYEEIIDVTTVRPQTLCAECAFNELPEPE